MCKKKKKSIVVSDKHVLGQVCNFIPLMLHQVQHILLLNVLSLITTFE